MAARILPLDNPWESLTVAECGISLVQQLARLPQTVTDTAPAWLPSLWRIALLEAQPPDISEVCLMIHCERVWGAYAWSASSGSLHWRGFWTMTVLSHLPLLLM